MVTISPTRQAEMFAAGLADRDQCTAAVVADSAHVTPICNLLSGEGFGVDFLCSDELLSLEPAPAAYDLVLFDLVAFDGRWQDACERLRIRDEGVPIVVISENDSAAERIKGFECGADEFIGKPYSVNEVVARLRSLLRRSSLGKPSNTLRYVDLVLNLATRVVYRGDACVDLSRREFSLLSYFVQNAERIVTRKNILEEVWDMTGKYKSNIVDVYINYLRNKTEQGQKPRLIHTVRGRGYILHREPEIS